MFGYYVVPALTLLTVVGIFFMRFTGQGSMSLIARTIVPQWFVEKRGRALAMLNLGGVLSQTAFPLVNTLMIEAIGWRWAWRFWASLVGLFFAPIALFFYRDTPSIVGMRADGKEDSPTEDGEKKEEVDEFQGEYQWTLKEAIKTPALWILFFCNMERAAINTAITFHITKVASYTTALKAASIVSVQAFVGFPVSFVTGFLLDYIPLNIVLALTFVAQGIFCLCGGMWVVC